MLKSSIAKRLMLAGVAVGLLAAPAQAQLDTALSVAKSSTAAAAASQRQVEQLDDQADNAVREYRAVLQQKDNIELFVAQQDIFRASQESEIASLGEKRWDTLEGADAIQIRQAIRIAKGESAPGLVFAPVLAGN